MNTTPVQPTPGLSAARTPSILSPNRGLAFEGEIMVKKPGSKPAARRTVKRSAKSSTQPNAITIRGSAEWKDWLDQLAAKLRTRPTQLIDALLAEKAAQLGFAEPPPRIPS